MRFIWTARAIAKHGRGGNDPMHTISGLYTLQAAEGFIRQQREGCPWLVLSDYDQQIASGVGPSYMYVPGDGLRKVVAA